MGCKSSILAVGNFTQGLEDCLDYEVAVGEVNENALIACTVHQCETNESSELLAELVGCELWDLNTHHLDPSKFDAQLLRELNPQQTEQLYRLVAAGFALIFQPNG